jgi:CelD/BcsL family acetyltransferase involved in cellulose biosynthesis
MRDVEKKGARVEVFSQPEEIAGRLDTFIELHLARWRKDNLPGTLSRPGFPEFLRQICCNPPAGSRCQLYLLVHEGKPAAALMTFHFGASALYYQAGWDPDSALASLSPAVVLMAHSIRDAIAAGLHHYEFLRGDEAYKTRWTKTYRKTATVLVARNFAAKEYLRINRIKDLAKHLVSRQGASKSDPLDCAESQA